jgi:AICAR transformylase/IMP cyclohydrolase PurH
MLHFILQEEGGFYKNLGIPVIPVEDVTSYPSILGGRVKNITKSFWRNTKPPRQRE